MQLADAFLLTYTAAAKAIKPKESLTVSEWADAYRILSKEGSAEPGQWNTSRNPPLRAVMDALSERTKDEKVVFMKPVQFGGTEVGSNFIGYVMTHAKGPVAVVMPTERSLNDWVSQKFDPMASDTPAVAEVLAKKSNKSADNNAQRKKFTGGNLYFKTAGSTAELKSTSLRYVVADEVDEWDWTTTQGDPIDLLEARLTAFYDGKIYIVSTPTVKDASHIESEYEGGDQRQYHVPCPHCGEKQVLKWPNLRWEKDLANPKKITRVYYACEHNGCIIEEYSKTDMFKEKGHGGEAEWIPQAPGNLYKSFQINALYSPNGLGRSWMQLVHQWIDAQDDPKDLMAFLNMRLAESYADRSHDIKPNVLSERAEPYQLRTIPVGVMVITCGVDTQDDRLEMQILGHGRDGRTWPIDYHVIWGNPTDEKLWNALADYLQVTFVNKFGVSMQIEATAIDTGGHHTHEVYAFVRRARTLGIRRCIAIKGASTYGRAILGKPSMQDVNYRGKTMKRGVSLYTVGGDTAKHLLYNRLDGDKDKDPSERKVHFSNELDVSYYDQLVSEAYDPRKNKWLLKKGKRNEALDTWIYAVAASHHPELYLHKWRKSDWDNREFMVQPGTPNEKEVTDSPLAVTEQASTTKSSAIDFSGLAKRGRNGR